MTALYVPALQMIIIRAVTAAFTAFIISLLLGRLCINFQRGRSIGETIREEGPRQHAGKVGTPTGGGIFFIAAAVLAALIWVRSFPVFIIFTAALVGFGAIGFADDLLKILRGSNDGLRPRYKIGLQIIVTYCLLYLISIYFGMESKVYIPWRSDLFIEFGSWYHIAAVIFTVGLVNSANMADGLDGLAAGLGIISLLAVIALGVLFITNASQHVTGAFMTDERAELLVASGAMIGSLLGFLRYNARPANIFMGDTGSMAIGGVLAVLGLTSRNEILVLLISGVFVIESVSVILQVGSFKISRKRIFKMAPIHHHFEQLGWQEEKVVMRFWIASIVCAGAAVTAAVVMMM